MSSGPFVTTKYEDDELLVHPIRVQPEGSPVHGTPPAGAIDSSISAQVGGSRRTFGLHARGWRLVRTLGTAPNTFKRYNFLPCLTDTAWKSKKRGDSVTVDGTDWTIADLVKEVRR